MKIVFYVNFSLLVNWRDTLIYYALLQLLDLCQGEQFCTRSILTAIPSSAIYAFFLGFLLRAPLTTGSTFTLWSDHNCLITNVKGSYLSTFYIPIANYTTIMIIKSLYFARKMPYTLHYYWVACGNPVLKSVKFFLWFC